MRSRHQRQEPAKLVGSRGPSSNRGCPKPKKTAGESAPAAGACGAGRVRKTQFELQLPQTQAEGWMLRVETDPSLAPVTFDWVWRLDSIYSPSHPGPDHLSRIPRHPISSTLVHEWRSPGVSLASHPVLQVRPPLISERESPLGPFKGRKAPALHFLCKTNGA